MVDTLLSDEEGLGAVLQDKFGNYVGAQQADTDSILARQAIAEVLCSCQA